MVSGMLPCQMISAGMLQLRELDRLCNKVDKQIAQQRNSFIHSIRLYSSPIFPYSKIQPEPSSVREMGSESTRYTHNKGKEKKRKKKATQRNKRTTNRRQCRVINPERKITSLRSAFQVRKEINTTKKSKSPALTNACPPTHEGPRTRCKYTGQKRRARI